MQTQSFLKFTEQQTNRSHVPNFPPSSILSKNNTVLRRQVKQQSEILLLIHPRQRHPLITIYTLALVSAVHTFGSRCVIVLVQTRLSFVDSALNNNHHKQKPLIPHSYIYIWLAHLYVYPSANSERLMQCKHGRWQNSQILPGVSNCTSRLLFASVHRALWGLIINMHDPTNLILNNSKQSWIGIGHWHHGS